MALEIFQFPARSDNYGVLVHDADTGRTVSIDAPDAAAVGAAVAEKGWRLTEIFTTHHHADHTDGNLALKALSGCVITGPQAEEDRIPGIDNAVVDGDTIYFAGHPVRIIATPGHTLGHIAYHFRDDGIAFVGDTLFALGCGRVFEGTLEQMWRSVDKLAALPDETIVYCGHEYTESNLRYALSVTPDDAALNTRGEEIRRLRAAGQPTVPTTIAAEKATNPFVCAREPAIAAALHMTGSPAADVFAALRRGKDNFK